MEIVIVGGGIAGLGLALNLHKRGIPSRVFESAPEIRELGVGITLLPHAMRELTELGLQNDLLPLGIENRESLFFNRFGQLIYKEPLGRYAGYRYPELGIHRGRLHVVMYESAVAQLGRDRIVTNRACAGLDQDAAGVTLQFRETSTGAAADDVRADVVVGCDGVNSTVRKRFYPDERMAFAGINTWRGVSRHAPILGGRSYLRVGSIRTGKLVIYPIGDDRDGRQLINWVAEIEKPSAKKNDWNKPGSLGDFLPVYRDWRFDWLDVPEMLGNSELILEYPMVDKDPVARWTFGRVTLAGDAAHPMYPRGANGAAQALIDSRTLADLLRKTPDPLAALAAYEQERLPATAKVVRTNRAHPPDYINIRVEELTGDRPFDNLDKFISQEELRDLSDRYKRVAGFAMSDLS
jgi:2-polyprenyl-6-methoxyphenol hydroxylase-like FAD-dependent oxidoreductase